MKIIKTCAAWSLILLLASCASSKLTTTAVAYQSVRTLHGKPEVTDQELANLHISLGYAITPDGRLVAAVYNPTSQIMVIDQTRSFFVDTSGKSYSYYDPTVRTTSVTDLSSSTRGASVNLGAVAGALGVGGGLGQLMRGINVGGSNTVGESVTNTTYVADQPKVSLAPKGTILMSKNFDISGIGTGSLRSSGACAVFYQPNEAPRKFSVCISYSLDGGETFDKLVTEFYENSRIVVPVEQKGRTNAALRKIFLAKSDATHEPLWLLHFVNNIPTGNNSMMEGTLFDYQ